MEKSYKSVNGELVEYSPEEYAQANIDEQNFLTITLPRQIRKERNKLLAESDWTQVADIPFTVEQKQAWVTYRQALRDITKQEGFPTNVVFPKQPQ